MRRETAVALALFVLVVAYAAWGTSNVIRTWEAEPATPAVLAALVATSAPTPAAPAAAAAPTAVAAVSVTGVSPSPLVEATTAAAGAAPLATSPVEASSGSSSALPSPTPAPAATATAPATRLAVRPAATATRSTAVTLPTSTPMPTVSAPTPESLPQPTVAHPTVAPLTPAPAPAAGPRQAIAGLTYPDISARLSTAFGMNCTGPVGSNLLTWQCVALSVGGTVRLTAVVTGLDATRIVSVTGVVSQSGQSDATAGSDFLGVVAALPFQGAQAQQARAWLLAHLGGEGRISIGGEPGAPPTLLSLSGTPAVRTLDVYAPQALEVGR